MTNKYDEWLKAVDYIYKKHAEEYSKLNVFEKYCAYMNFVHDAQGRAFNSGKTFLSICYKIMLNTIFIPARFVLKYHRVKAQKKYRL